MWEVLTAEIIDSIVDSVCCLFTAFFAFGDQIFVEDGGVTVY